MKTAILFILGIITFSSCKSNPTEPIIQQGAEGTILYKYIDKDVFKSDISLTITQRLDTLFDAGGVYRIIEMPTVNAILTDGLYLESKSTVYYSTGEDSIKQDTTAWLSAGSHLFVPGKMLTFRIKDVSQAEFHIKLFSNQYLYLKAGVRIK